MAGLHQHLLASEFEHGRLAYRRDCPRCRPRRLGDPARQAAVVPAGVAALITAASLAPAAAAAAKTHGPTPAPPPPPPATSTGAASGNDGAPPGLQCPANDPTCSAGLPADPCPDGSCDPTDTSPVDSPPPATAPLDGPAPPPDSGITTGSGPDPTTAPAPAPAAPAPAPAAPAPAPTDTTAAPVSTTSAPTDTAPSDTSPAAGTTAATAPATPAPAAPSATTTPAPPPPPPAAPTVAPPPEASVPHSLGSIGNLGRLRDVEQSRVGERAAIHRQASAKPGSGPVIAPAATRSQSDSATTQPTATTQTAPQPSSDSHGKTYVVRAGDSLWLIAKSLLAPGASNADIAHLVNSLWTLNSSRIATGNPNLLRVGVVLVLP